MPKSPKGPCTGLGGACPNRAVSFGRCEDHRRKGDPKAREFYTSRQWRVLSQIVRREEPVCRGYPVGPCGKPTTEADHILSIRDGGAKLDRANVTAWCGDCDRRKTAADRARRGGGGRVAGSPRQVSAGRPQGRAGSMAGIGGA